MATDQKVSVRFPALPDFLRSSGSGTGSTQPLSTIEELLERKSSGSGLEDRKVIRSADYATPLYPQRLTLTSPASGYRSVDVVRSRSQATEFVCLMEINVHIGLICFKSN
jgi:hypothetical protein